MNKFAEKENLSVANRDFGLRWHALAVGVIAAAVLALYFMARKLVLG